MSDKAVPPTRATATSAGLDLYATENILISAHSQATISTDIRIALPQGYYGRIAPRSGLASRHGIHIGAGTVDYGYRGIIKVVVFNLSQHDYAIVEGHRIAQLICEKICIPTPMVVDSIDSDTQRGTSGFGSSG